MNEIKGVGQGIKIKYFAFFLQFFVSVNLFHRSIQYFHYAREEKKIQNTIV